MDNSTTPQKTIRVFTFDNSNRRHMEENIPLVEVFNKLNLSLKMGLHIFVPRCRVLEYDSCPSLNARAFFVKPNKQNPYTWEVSPEDAEKIKKKYNTANIYIQQAARRLMEKEQIENSIWTTPFFMRKWINDKGVECDIKDKTRKYLLIARNNAVYIYLYVKAKDRQNRKLHPVVPLYVTKPYIRKTEVPETFSQITSKLMDVERNILSPYIKVMLLKRSEWLGEIYQRSLRIHEDTSKRKKSKGKK